MQNWNYIPENSFSLPLAADARLSNTDYTNDQCWELKSGNSDPPALSLETTFGLRARLCRIFPRFIYQDHIVTDPQQFSHPILIRRYYPNYIELTFKPFSFINVNLEYWVPNSHAITSRIKLTNTGNEQCDVQVEWLELLLPSAEGQRMILTEIGLSTFLAGRTSDISPVFFLTGGVQPGKSPYPSLGVPFTIPARGYKQSQWVHACLDGITPSYDLAKEVVSKEWDTEIAHIQRVNSKMLEIYTGNKDWDNVFFLSQVIACQLFLQPSGNLDNPSFVLARRPDQGYSFRKDGSDYNYQWNGQSSLDSYYIMNFLLPSYPELLRGLLENFLSTQNLDGEVDWKPGLGGQRSHLLATPVLAEIAYKLFQVNGDALYLQTIFPKLLAFFLSWFSETHDRDADRIPEWDRPVQAGYEDHPLFSTNHPWSKGVDISTVESPALASFVFNECNYLMKIARLINENEVPRRLAQYKETLLSMVEGTWSDQRACYLNRDRDSHGSNSDIFIGTHQGEGVLEIDREFDPPVRPLIRLDSQGDVTQPCQIFIHGNGASGKHRVEQISSQQVSWSHGQGFVTSGFIYSTIDRIILSGVRTGDIVQVTGIDCSVLDLSLLFPLWAGIPAQERAKILINLSIMNKKKFLCPHGLRSYLIHTKPKEHENESIAINLPWINLVLEGFVRYGERDKAAEVFIRLMKAVIRSFRYDMTLHQSYNCETGDALGAEDTLTSLVPIGVFLKILGIKIYNPFKVEIAGENPFPWPVTVKYQGLTIIKHTKKTLVIMPDGENITVSNDHSHLLSGDKIN